ncbi:NAD(P)/FAD-dependent oxidoreductase [Nitratireductor sp. ZSWI3]|uniref:NAD(P)/FAD-dependent oxidoreductase n=1 Tax=Nitratireductor sp. ZSWI3 TaxID=2966359 RepID=UPI00214FA475|nr:FAD-dependent oxidoreductase [Nitratireductor sp. ZSWI3]MCR4269010.1 FAD-dependent oxidoreductase [Nitratireductor sp. ZSWI3]
MGSGIVIIGAGECGVRAAFALREEGYRGAVTLIGAEPHLPYERPPLSKGGPLPKVIAEEARYGEADITLRRAVRVTGIDTAARAVALSDGSILPYDKLLIATGAQARRFPGMEAAGTLRSLDDASAILGALRPGARLAVIGGGFIGLELAATARRLGAGVTVIEVAERLMARVVPAEIAAVFEARHRAEGVDLILSATVAGVDPIAVVLGDGRRIEADIVVAGVGAVPDTRLAEEAGLAVADGIVVDHRLKTQDAHIFAAGDCCRFPYRGSHVRLESWRCAQDQGAHAARAMLGAEDPFSRTPWFWSDQYDLGLQVAGLPDPARPFIRRDLGEEAFVLFQLDDAGLLSSASGVGFGNAVARHISVAEKLIERAVPVPPAQLSDAKINLKKLLKG